MLAEEVEAWTVSNDYNYYLGYGGGGDALLLIAKCWQDPQARIVFFENGGSINRDLFELFDLDVFLHDNVLFTPLGKKIFESLTSKPTFKPSAHLPDLLDHSDWVDWQKYKDRLVTETPWKTLIGGYDNPFETRGIIGICPSGAHRDLKRQRFLTDYEYRKLVGKMLLQGYTVVTIDSPEHLWQYPKIGHKHSLRCCSSFLEFSDGTKTPINLGTMLQIINASTFCISVDTWLSIYCNLAGVPVKTVQTRWNGSYKKFNTHGDYIFMNPEIWPTMELVTAEEICY